MKKLAFPFALLFMVSINYCCAQIRELPPAGTGTKIIDIYIPLPPIPTGPVITTTVNSIYNVPVVNGIAVQSDEQKARLQRMESMKKERLVLRRMIKEVNDQAKKRIMPAVVF